MCVFVVSFVWPQLHKMDPPGLPLPFASCKAIWKFDSWTEAFRGSYGSRSRECLSRCESQMMWPHRRRESRHEMCVGERWGRKEIFYNILLWFLCVLCLVVALVQIVVCVVVLLHSIFVFYSIRMCRWLLLPVVNDAYVSYRLPLYRNVLFDWESVDVVKKHHIPTEPFPIDAPMNKNCARTWDHASAVRVRRLRVFGCLWVYYILLCMIYQRCVSLGRPIHVKMVWMLHTPASLIRSNTSCNMIYFFLKDSFSIHLVSVRSLPHTYTLRHTLQTTQPSLCSTTSKVNK